MVYDVKIKFLLSLCFSQLCVDLIFAQSTLKSYACMLLKFLEKVYTNSHARIIFLTILYIFRCSIFFFLIFCALCKINLNLWWNRCKIMHIQCIYILQVLKCKQKIYFIVVMLRAIVHKILKISKYLLDFVTENKVFFIFS